MTINNLKISRFYIAIALPLTLALLLVLFTFSHLFLAHSNKLSIGVTIDLIFTVPLLHILFGRGHKYSKYITSLFFTTGLLLASLIIPKNNQVPLHEIKLWIVPAIELLTITFLVVKSRQVYARHAIATKHGGDFYDILKTVTGELLPKRLAAIVCAEVGTIYYGFINWQKPAFNQTSFSYHKKTGTLLIIGVFIFMILVETAIFHLLLAKWSTKAAWVLSGISLYTAIQLFGIAKSICKRPIRITERQLFIPYGILAEATFDLSDIAGVSLADKQPVMDENTKHLSPFRKIEEPNVMIRLKSSHIIDGIYGKQKHFDVLLISVDEARLFIEQLRENIQLSVPPCR